MIYDAAIIAALYDDPDFALTIGRIVLASNLRSLLVLRVEHEFFSWQEYLSWRSYLLSLRRNTQES